MIFLVMYFFSKRKSYKLEFRKPNILVVVMIYVTNSLLRLVLQCFIQISCPLFGLLSFFSPLSWYCLSGMYQICFVCCYCNILSCVDLHWLWLRNKPSSVGLGMTYVKSRINTQNVLKKKSLRTVFQQLMCCIFM